MRVVILTRDRQPDAAPAFANVLARHGLLAGIVTERAPIRFSTAKPRRPSLGSPEGRQWLRAALRRTYGAVLVTEPARILGDKLVSRVADMVERRWFPAPTTVRPFPDTTTITAVDALNSPEGVAAIRALDPDVIVVVSTGLLSAEVIETAKRAAINWHPSFLPTYRGVYCELFQLYFGDEDQVGTTWHHLASVVDGGGIVLQERTVVECHDDFHTLRAKNIATAAWLLPDAVRAAAEGVSHPPGPPGRQFFLRDVTAAVKLRVMVKCLIRRGRWRLGLTRPLPTY